MIDRQQGPICARCGFERSEHSYNGACYGICGEFIEKSRVVIVARRDEVCAVATFEADMMWLATAPGHDDKMARFLPKELLDLSVGTSRGTFHYVPFSNPDEWPLWDRIKWGAARAAAMTLVHLHPAALGYPEWVKFECNGTGCAERQHSVGAAGVGASEAEFAWKLLQADGWTSYRIDKDVLHFCPQCRKTP